MRTFLNATIIAILVAGAGWLAGCESTRAPATPSEASRTPSVGVVGSNQAPTVAWHCMASGPVWQATDCVAPAGPVRLSTRAVALSAPGAPSNLTGGVSAARVTLAWQAPSAGDPPTSYVVEAGSSTGRSDLANFDTGSNVPGLVADSVPPGTYFIRVRAKNSVGVSAASNELVLIVLGAAGCPPPAPTNLVATASGSTVTLRWASPTGACVPTGYIIEAGSIPGASNLANFNTGTTTTSYVAGGVGAGTYYVRVRATNAAGTSAASDETTLIVSGNSCTAAPSAPPGLTGSVAGSIVSLAWGSVVGASSYILEAGTGPGLTNVTVSDEGAATSLSATAGNGTYYVRVRARNSCGTSGASNEVVVTVGAASCSYIVSPATQSIAAAGGIATATVTTSAGCSWNAVSNSPFISVTSGASGSGSGTVTYSLGVNSGSSARTGTLAIAGQTVTVTQQGVCGETLSATQISIDATGGTASISVTSTSSACTWTAQAKSSFVSVTSGASGSGNGTVVVSFQANAGAARSGAVTIAGQDVVINQAAPLPALTRNDGCGGGGRGLTDDASIQFINTTPNTITVTQPDTGGVRMVAPNSGYTQPTKVNTVYVVTSGGNCIGNYVAASGGRSAIVGQ